MPTEIRRINVASVVRVAVPLGVVSGVLGVLPFVFDLMAARTPGRFALEIGILLITSAIASAIVVAILAVAYNVVSKYVGGIEVTLSK